MQNYSITNDKENLLNRSKPTTKANNYAKYLIEELAGYYVSPWKSEHSHCIVISFNKGNNHIKEDLNYLHLEIERNAQHKNFKTDSPIGAIGFPDYHNSRSGRNMDKPLPNPDRADMLVFCRNEFEAKKVEKSVSNLSDKFANIEVRHAVGVSFTIQDTISDLITAYAQDNFGLNGRMYEPIFYSLFILKNTEAQAKTLQGSSRQDNVQTDVRNRQKTTKAA
ncbi:hypothetical protein [Methylophaga sp.]|uniref:hypothetical protein n=1 Tax=Methylophaga sp. TaxID=2024840 RepID=UPI003F707D5D